MAPPRGRKHKPTSLTTSDTAVLRVPPILLATQAGSVTRTPIGSPIKQRVTITAAQKQALIDNLQLEITERARKLRAQYALQAQALKTRLEIRVHRIPTALRKANLGELLQKYAEKQASPNAQTVQSPKRVLPTSAKKAIPTSQSAALPIQSSAKGDTIVVASPKAPGERGTKRTSTDMDSNADKENETVSNPKKRTRTIASQPRAASRIMSRRVPPSQILSPKSNNSRTLPHPPLKASLSPIKAGVARPVSPLKPLSADAVAPTASSLARIVDKTKVKAAPPRAVSRQILSAAIERSRRGAQAGATGPMVIIEEGEGRHSDLSNATRSSVATTIVSKTKVTKIQTALKTKRAGLVEKFTGIGGKGKKVVASKVEKEAVGVTAMSGRVLRKRA